MFPRGPFKNTKDLNERKTRGQATVEYALLIGIAAAIGLAFLTTFNQVVNDGFLTFNAQLERELITAGFAEAESGWEN